MDNWNMIDATNAQIVEKRFQEENDPRDRHRYWPSEASIAYTDEHGVRRILGKCIRAVAYSALGVQRTDAIDARGLRIMHMGKIIEACEQQWAKDAGLWWGSNVKFRHRVGHMTISGEVDMFIRRPDGTIEGIEFKSGYGYFFESEIFGNTRKFGYPKPDHLMQVVLYLDHYDQVETFGIVYVNRGDLSRAEHRVSLVQQENGDKTIRVITRAKDKVNDIVDERFTVNSIYQRFMELDNYLNDDTIPPRDYSIQWDNATIEREWGFKNISKSKYDKWKSRKQPIGDWMCRYCSYVNLCYNENTPGDAYPCSDIPHELKPEQMKIRHANK